MFVDASVMAAILLQEAEGERLAAEIDDAATPLVTNVIAVWETTAAIHRKKNMPISVSEERVLSFLSIAGVETLPVSAGELSLALTAFDRYGRHRYSSPADRNKGLNLADCFHYASAKSRAIPILTTDEGFALTDLPTIGPRRSA
ncbi:MULTISPECIES: type II toxin-antitoxin system VapC family toxin [Methylosinus]|uniref:PIN domain-containing protein n=1 Tax=Methylosinus trichosporium (strain ATCC 35070 / NCIMB 11131 / UNIQEM 75 / OB3b) TaxID=595536 RepID=A0A2D2CZ90_METT3|nr:MULTISPECIES: type II toxin-antitoxin system VapC family toxin [Methylosinus]ATQ68071.1 PIN domain-containing protein [Methylosinus trichosporium OB3b]OBS51520.1 twitching motility protein PilT [Methylosinus sp. 3S-1]